MGKAAEIFLDDIGLPFYLLFILWFLSSEIRWEKPPNFFWWHWVTFLLVFIIWFLSSEIRWEKPPKYVVMTLAYLSTCYLFYGSHLRKLDGKSRRNIFGWHWLTVLLFIYFMVPIFTHCIGLQTHYAELSNKTISGGSMVRLSYLRVCSYIHAHTIQRWNQLKVSSPYCTRRLYMLRGLKVGYVDLGVHCATDI